MFNTSTPTSTSDVTCLIVTYNSADHIIDLLADLSIHAPNSQVIVVDNASTDGTAKLIARQFPKVNLVKNRQNVGYARAVNKGAALCSTPYIFLLNPDIRISSPAIFNESCELMENQPQLAACGPLQFQEGKRGLRLNLTWSYYSKEAMKLFLSYLFKRPVRSKAPIRVRFLNAGCLFLRRESFERVGRLNQKYFLYGEEPDLFLKFLRYRYECLLLPSVSVIHYREQSIKKVQLPDLLRIRFMALYNVTDALIRGWSKILRDRLYQRPRISRQPFFKR